MKKIFRRCLAVVSVLGCFVLTSCLLDSSFPLSKTNNCSESELEGTWLSESRLDNGNVKKDTVEIRDDGSRYVCIRESVETGSSGDFSSRKVETENSSFILTKLEDHYFASYLTEKGAYQIFKIEFTDDSLKVFGLTREGEELAKKEVVYKTPLGRIITKISQPKLQAWCLKHQRDFSVELIAYRKLQPPPAPADPEKRD